MTGGLTPWMDEKQSAETSSSDPKDKDDLETIKSQLEGLQAQLDKLSR